MKIMFYVWYRKYFIFLCVKIKPHKNWIQSCYIEKQQKCITKAIIKRWFLVTFETHFLFGLTVPGNGYTPSSFLTQTRLYISPLINPCQLTYNLLKQCYCPFFTWKMRNCSIPRGVICYCWHTEKKIATYFNRMQENIQSKTMLQW